ncbi:MAG: cytochrome c [Gammaproteobacteria bacterium]|nr:cytochrome c [Gammaproteobacteria bacterium]
MRLLILIATLAVSAPVLAKPTLVTEELPAETRQVLIEEMQAIAAAMGRIHTAMVTGDHAAVAKEAAEIKASFVLKQKLTKEQRHQIHEMLPQAFIAMDRSFHELAGELARAAEQEDTSAERATFERMSETCQGCHATFASKRFPGLE